MLIRRRRNILNNATKPCMDSLKVLSIDYNRNIVQDACPINVKPEIAKPAQVFKARTERGTSAVRAPFFMFFFKRAHQTEQYLY